MTLSELTASLSLPSPIQQLNSEWLDLTDTKVRIKRDDLIHPNISGNKWRKLKYALAEMERKRTQRLVSFGGGHSNHLHALAFACHSLGIQLEAIIRGQYQQHPTQTLLDMQQWGANLHYVTKAEYHRRNDAAYQAELQQRFPNAVVIPEGGSQTQALHGVRELLSEQAFDYDHIIVPVGSGGTLAGLMTGLLEHPHIQVHGIAVLKGQGYLESLVNTLLDGQPHSQNWRIHHHYHHGGYAKTTPQLNEFCDAFSQANEVPVEPVYSGKAAFALRELLTSGIIPSVARVLLLHTGGLR